MDIITHALAGAATGAAFGRPLLGAVVAVVPDSALWLRPRQPRPPAAYRAAHGLLAPCLAGSAAMMLFGPAISALVFFAWLSHIVLDIPTHGADWSPRLFWPDERPVFTKFQEWEWFNRSWWLGLALTAIWSITWLALSKFATGFLS